MAVRSGPLRRPCDFLSDHGTHASAHELELQRAEHDWLTVDRSAAINGGFLLSDAITIFCDTNDVRFVSLKVSGSPGLRSASLSQNDPGSSNERMRSRAPSGSDNCIRGIPFYFFPTASSKRTHCTEGISSSGLRPWRRVVTECPAAREESPSVGSHISAPATLKFPYSVWPHSRPSLPLIARRGPPQAGLRGYR